MYNVNSMLNAQQSAVIDGIVSVIKKQGTRKTKAAIVAGRVLCFLTSEIVIIVLRTNAIKTKTTVAFFGYSKVPLKSEISLKSTDDGTLM
jgi:hypothetical protein